MNRTTLKYRSEPGATGVTGAKKLIRHLFAIILMVLLASGCGKTPAPVTEAGIEFPENRYLTVRGTGKTENEAGKQAMAELSGIFESRISSQFTSLSTSSMTQDQAEAFEKKMASRIRIDSDMVLQGARIGTSWKDEETGLYNALAVLDRSDAGQTWASQVDAIDSEIRAEVRALNVTQGPLSRMAGLNRIIGKSMDRRVLEGRCRVIDYPVADLTEPEIGSVISEQTRLKSELMVYIMVGGEEGYRVGEIIAQGLTEKGITLVNDPGSANASVTGRVEVALVDLGNPDAEFVRARGSVQVFETQAQTLFAQINEKVRKGHRDQNEARLRAVESVARSLAKSLLVALGYSGN